MDEMAEAKKRLIWGVIEWGVPLKNWTGNKSFRKPGELEKKIQSHRGRGQADDSLPGSGAGSPGLSPCLKGCLQ